MTLGERIYRLRRSLNLSQKEFADKIGVAQSSVNYWENGNREPKISQLIKISEKFNVSLSSLLGFPLPSGATIFEDEHGNEMISTSIEPENMFMALYMDDGMKTIYHSYRKLNKKGQKKVVEYTTDLTQIEKYAKKEEE